MSTLKKSLFRVGSRSATPEDKSRVGMMARTASIGQADSPSEVDERRLDTISLASLSPEKRLRGVTEKLLEEQRALLEEKKAELQRVMEEEVDLKAQQRELQTSIEGQSMYGESSEDEGGEQFGFGIDAPAIVVADGHVTPKKSASVATMDGRQGSMSSVASSVSLSSAGRRQTEPHRPSTTVGKRTVTIARRAPNEALGFELRTVAVPVGSVRDGIDRDKLRQATFVDGLSAESPAYRAGVRRGDQILEIDGENCEQAKEDAISRLLSRNHGTVVLTVRTTSDFQRAMQFDKYLGQLRLLKQKKEELSRVMDEEQELSQYYSNFKFQQERRMRAAQSLDLCTAPVLSMPLLCEDLPLLVQLMQAQWAAERRDGIPPERAPEPVSDTDSEDGDQGADIQATMV